MTTPAPLLKGFARTVDRLKPDPRKRVTAFDPDTRGLCVRVTPKGKKTFTIVARDPAGKQVWREVGGCDEITLEDARTKAREGVRRIKEGLDPFPEAEKPRAPDTVGDVVRNFLKRYVEAKGLRSASEIERIFNVYVLPEWGDRPYTGIRRADVAAMLDGIEDNHGPVMADRVLAWVRKLLNWQATRDDDYTPPIIPGMARTKPAERSRERILTDDEIRLLWPILSETGSYGALCQILLLTGQRKAKVAAMQWEDISEDGVWTIPTAPREKGNPGAVKLPKMALDIIRAQKKVAGNPYVFAGRGAGHISAGSPAKRDLDARILDALRERAKEAGADPAKVKAPPPFTLHDFRRSARSLMAAAGVDSEIAERVIGHKIAGVRGVYDRHDYADEKAAALARLANHVRGILSPAAAKVVPMKRRARK